MTTFKKYFLIDPEKYEQLLIKNEAATNNDILTHPNIKAVKEIDSKMTSILNDNMKSDQEKIEEYSTNLDSYLRNFKNALEVPKRDAILGTKKKDDILSTDLELSQTRDKHTNVLDQSATNVHLSGIPASYRPNASHLTSYIKKHKNFEIDQNGSLKYKGKKMFDSDYNKLLESVVRFRKPLDGKTDINEFVSLLRQEGYPVTRLAYVRRNDIRAPKPVDKSSSTIVKRKTSKIQRSIERLSSGLTPKKTAKKQTGGFGKSPAKNHIASIILGRWAGV